MCEQELDALIWHTIFLVRAFVSWGDGGRGLPHYICWFPVLDWNGAIFFGANRLCVAFLGTVVVCFCYSMLSPAALGASGGAMACGAGCGTKPLAGVDGAMEEESVQCLPLDSFTLLAEVTGRTVPEVPGASKVLTLDEFGTDGRDLAGDRFFNGSWLGEDKALFLDFCEYEALALSMETASEEPLVESVAKVRDFAMKISFRWRSLSFLALACSLLQ